MQVTGFMTGSAYETAGNHVLPGTGDTISGY